LKTGQLLQAGHVLDVLLVFIADVFEEITLQAARICGEGARP